MAYLPEIRIGEGHYNAGKILSYLQDALEKMIEEFEEHEEKIEKLEKESFELKGMLVDQSSANYKITSELRAEIKELKEELKKYNNVKSSDKMSRIENWFLYKQGFATGYCYNHGRHDDGTPIKTTSVQQFNKEEMWIQTKNTKYKLGIPCEYMNLEYLNSFGLDKEENK